ncbi:outer membrane protein assembly complex, YaeT protein [Sulfuricurvum kujiense DSM 16994]|uniref:Outer membrane protein assembly factor BamA n=1 Tax=Sulfuricurvum kujiense (strain ATCC BAA-921 / DSM 16994 / JCM 11577 / YK-1) TaxID=709032 RepID=E4TZL1_SULKY|nr:outer membrane protein assembly factor BamA [Sulfuricurvum kujiense]ADR33099.1 outer membrane protein assembly complex, YaeT protein [Sulfuricurvum kujiense DSM 16994]
MKTITLSLIVASALVHASAQNVQSIHYDGMVHISEAVAKRLNEVKVGEPLNAAAVDKTVKNFFEQGYFEDVWAEEEEGKVTFHFKEKPTISKIELKGYKENDEEAKKALLQIDKGSLYDPKRVEEAKKRIVDALSQDGKIDSVVEIETEKLENGSMRVTFIANEGQEIIIKKLTYAGVLTQDSEEFDSMIANKEEQFMGWMWGRNDGKMKVAELQYDPLRIRDFYMQRGFLDAKIDEPFVAVDFDHYTAQMSYNIFEGDVYRVSDILLFQDTKVIDDQALLDVITLEKNKPFNIKTFREDAERIKTKIADLGYAYVQVQPDLKKDKEGKSVDVVYRIIPGKKVHIRKVIISGNNRTLDRVVRRELFLAPGDLYSLTNLKDSRNAIGRTGYFESNTIEEKRIDDETMDLIVQTKEAPTGNIQLGGGYGSFGGILVSVAVSDRNIFGSGINVGLNLEKSQRTSNYSFNISNPRLNDSDFSGNFSVYNSSTEYDSYSTDSKGISVGTGHRFNRFVNGYVGYNYSQNSYSDIDLNTTTLDPRYYESYSKSSVVVSATFDNTDDYYVPREGMTLSESIEMAGVGGDAEFWKSRTTFGVYQGLQKWTDFDLILRYKARFNYASEGGGYLPLGEKFYMGGIGSVRGYQAYSISPTKGVDRNGDPYKIGGTQTFSNNLEFSVPLVPEAKMRATAFIDYGMIGESSISEIKRGGYGVSLEWFSPVGPLQLVFANPIGDKEHDDIAHFEFTIGQRF